jgi:hypothetical protein
MSTLDEAAEAPPAHCSGLMNSGVPATSHVRERERGREGERERERERSCLCDQTVWSQGVRVVGQGIAAARATVEERPPMRTRGNEGGGSRPSVVPVRLVYSATLLLALASLVSSFSASPKSVSMMWPSLPHSTF